MGAGDFFCLVVFGGQNLVRLGPVHCPCSEAASRNFNEAASRNFNLARNKILFSIGLNL